MGKLADSLAKQLKTSHKEDAENCIKIYDKLKEMSGGKVWESQWSPLVDTSWEGTYLNAKRISRPSAVGKIFLEGLNK